MYNVLIKAIKNIINRFANMFYKFWIESYVLNRVEYSFMNSKSIYYDYDFNSKS